MKIQKLNTQDMTKILGRSKSKKLFKWSEKIEEMSDIKILKDSKMGLVMMRMNDMSHNETFNLGEVLITDCTVTIDDMFGYGVIMGNQPDRAKAMAIIDAIIHSKDMKWKSLITDFNSWLEEEMKQQEKEDGKEFALIKKSRVEFETMNEMEFDTCKNDI